MKKIRSKRSSAFFVASVYFLLSLLWIIVSDKVVLFFIDDNTAKLSRLQTFKGIVFIILSSLVVYILVKINTQRHSLLNKKLKREKTHYQSLFENVNDAILLLHDKKFIDCNQQALKLFACKRSDLIFSGPVEFSPEYQSDGLLSEEKAIRLKNTAMVHGITNFEWKFRKKSGEEFDALVSLSKVKDDNEPRLIAIIRDISEWKKIMHQVNEDQLFIKSLTEQSPDIIYLYDVAEKRNIYTNKDLGQILGYRTDEYTVNSAEFFRLYMHPDDMVMFDEYVEFIADWQSQFVFSYEYRLRAKDGQWRWFSGNEKEFKRENGKIVMIIGTVRDITEKKQAEDNLKKSEMRFYNVFNNNQTLMTIYDSKSLKRIDVNKQFEIISGYGKEEIIGKPLEEINLISEKSEYEEFINKTSPEDEVLIKEFTLITKHRGERKLRISRQYLDIAENSLILVSANDITEQKLAEKLLADNESRLKSIVDKAFDPLYICNSQGDILDVNEVACQIMGYQRDELLGMTIFQTDEKIKGMDKLNKLISNLEDVSPLTIESVHIKKNGEKFPVEIRIGEFHSEGKNYLIGFARDITARVRNENLIKESELKYRTIIENMSDGLVIFDRKGIIHSVNIAFSSMHGYSSAGLISTDVKLLYHSDNYHDLEQCFISIDSMGFYEGEIKLIHKNGSVIHTHMKGTKVFLQQDAFYQVVVRDITEKRELEKKLMQAIIETEEKERERIAKDLHDGLGPILSAIKLYIKWANDPNTKTPREFIYQKSSVTIDEAISALREISANLSPHILRNFGLVQAISSFIEVLNVGSEFSIEFIPGFNNRFNETIETSIYRIVTECINNTIKHASAKGIKITLDHQDDSLVLKYSDDGVGFDVDKVMDKPVGRGLLNMTNRIKSLNGTIIFEGSPNNGTVIEVKIPT